MNIVRELFTSDPAALWRALISSTVLLASGLAAGALLRRRPPHAHQALGLAIACALLAPAATELVRRSGLGLLAARDPAAALVPAGVATAPPDEDAAGESARAGDSTAAAAGPASTRAFGVFAGAPSVPAPGQLRQADEDLTAQPAGPARSRVDWSAWGLAAWAGTSLLILVRGMLAWRRARLLASRAQTVGDDTLRRALARATQRAQLARAPRLASSGDITCPVVWAWSRQPLLIVPQATVGGGAVELDWEAVFAHELAHLQRRDHLPQALASLLCALLPWHPLTWFARARLTRWAELACDDRVLEAGHPAAGYAETLLAFVPAARNPWIAAAVTRGTALRGRLKRILEDAPTPSRVTTGWRRVALAFAALATMAVACAQPGRAVAASDTVAETDAPPGAPQSGTAIAGDVASGDGRPVLGARVELFLQEPPGPAATLVATLLTDEQGRFALEDGRDDGHWWLRVSAPGFGQQWLYRAESANGETPTPTHVVLLPAQRLAGTVVNEEGAPVPGVMLTLSTEFPEDDPHRSLPRSPDHAHRTSTQTDAEGRFAFDQLQGRTVALMLEHSDYSQTMSPDSPRVETGQQDVRLVIQRGLTLHGVVTADGKPIAGVALHTSAPNLSKRPLGHWDIVTDAEGRFEIRGISTLLSRGVASSIATPLIALSVETPEWTSPMYRVFDRYGPELSFVTIEATRRQQPPAVPGSTQDPASGAQPGGRPPS
ncbi:MAG TPA: M56 family metallopeptidase, partial [Planctomycetota bacterium]|nr:M56 family metallopeptidase [Planctomycetota bacterium]